MMIQISTMDSAIISDLQHDLDLLMELDLLVDLDLFEQFDLVEERIPEIPSIEAEEAYDDTSQ